MTQVTIQFTSYNHAPYLRRAIDSALNQTFTDFELVIIDDCSEDESRDIIRSYHDPRITIQFPDRRYMRRHGEALMHNAEGRYIAIHHSDDAWMPDKLAKQVAFLDANPDHAAVFTRVTTINEADEVVPSVLSALFKQRNRSRHEWLRTFFYSANLLCHPSALIRKEVAIKTYPSYGLTGLPDLYKWINICLESEIFILPEPLTLFRIHQDGKAEGSSANSENHIRFQTEWQWILRQYRKLSSLGDWLKVFPELRAYIVKGDFEPDFAFARLCLEANYAHRAKRACASFALNLLYDLMDNPDTRDRIERLYHFTINDFAELVKKNNVFEPVRNG